MRSSGPRPPTPRPDTGPTAVEWLVLGLVFAVAAVGWFLLRQHSELDPARPSVPAAIGGTSPDAPAPSPH